MRKNWPSGAAPWSARRVGRRKLAGIIRKLALLLLILVGGAGALADPLERGLPLFTTFPAKTHGGGAQFFSVTQDAAGMLHFGSLQGVFTHDGAWWRNTELPNQSAVFSVAGGRGPEVAVGAYGEMGYLTRGSDGTLVYRSLVPQLPQEFRETGDVRSVCATPNGFLFVGERALFAWNGGAPRVAADFRPVDNPPNRCHKTWLFGGNGLQRAGSPLILLHGKRVESVIDLDETRVLASVPGEGLYLVDGFHTTPFAPDASAWLRDKTVVGGTRAGGRIVIGTRQNGIAILGLDGTLDQRLDVTSGLPADVLGGLLTDREGAVWLAYHGPIVRLDLASPVTLLDDRIGLHGQTNALTRFNGKLYVATSHGLVTEGRRVDGIPSPVWSLLAVGEQLYAGTGDGLFVLDANHAARRIDGTAGSVIYDLLESRANPTRIWIATRKGLGTVDNGRFTGLIANSPPYPRSLVEHEGVLWAGSIFNGAIRFDGKRVETFGKDEVNVGVVANKVTANLDGRFVLPSNGQLVPDPRLPHVTSDFFRFAEDAQGNVWTNATPPQFVERRPDGTYAEAVALVSIDASNIQLVQAGPDGAIWFAGDDALYRYDSGAKTIATPQPRPLIQRVVAADGRLVTAPLPFSFRRVRVEFAPLSYQPGITYQYRLNDEAWSAWTTEPSIDYTNLDAGEHTFFVRARSAAGAISPDASWRFTVLPPWYRTRAATVLWIVLAVALLAIFVRLRTAALRRQTDRLRMLVEERTEELQHANAHLERLSLLDELTGIANRRFFQRALAEDWKNATEDRQPLALVLVDLDHFKQLNDRHGHPAGDAALVQVARFLSRHIRRSGEMPARISDIVARIGGEEFAILLANMTEDDAAHDAERLRAGIELLGITASCGVASMVPAAGESSDALVQHADRALYAAKAAGRNCVRRASETPGAAVAV